MLIFIWFALCIVFAIVNMILPGSEHALELFALLSGIVLFLIYRFKEKI
jgi:hypothetical protein